MDWAGVATVSVPARATREGRHFLGPPHLDSSLYEYYHYFRQLSERYVSCPLVGKFRLLRLQERQSLQQPQSARRLKAFGDAAFVQKLQKAAVRLSLEPRKGLLVLKSWGLLATWARACVFCALWRVSSCQLQSQNQCQLSKRFQTGLRSALSGGGLGWMTARTLSKFQHRLQ